jgi:hypothetical protein
MFRICLTVFLSVLLASAVAQEVLKPTSAISISGRVKSPKTVSFEELKKYKLYNLGDVVITNHKGDVKGTAKDLTGVLLKDFLQGVELDAENPKVLSEYYFICIASDGYKIIYSWNELFNTAIGNSVYILTSKDNQPLEKLDENIVMIATQDIRTGRRYVKNLQSIIVRRAE